MTNKKHKHFNEQAMEFEAASLYEVTQANFALEDEFSDLAFYMLEQQKVINLGDFNKYRESFKEEFHTDDNGAVAAFVLRSLYMLTLQKQENPLPFGMPTMFDFIRVMMPQIAVYRNSFKKNCAFYKLNIPNETASDGWHYSIETYDKGFLLGTNTAEEYDYVSRDCYMLAADDIKFGVLAKDGSDCMYDAGPDYMNEINKMFEFTYPAKRSLVLGLKTGALVVELLKHESATVTVVEQDNTLIEFFKNNILSKLKNKNVKFVNNDPIRYIKQISNFSKYDQIYVDCYNHAYEPGALEKFKEIKKVEGVNADVIFSYYSESVFFSIIKSYLSGLIIGYVSDEDIEDEDDFDGFEENDSGLKDMLLPDTPPDWIVDMFFKHDFKRYGDILSCLKFDNINEALYELAFD